VNKHFVAVVLVIAGYCSDEHMWGWFLAFALMVEVFV